MIVKDRTVPMVLQKLEAVNRLLLPGHRMRYLVESKLIKFRTGFQGERNLDYQLIALPEKDFHIYQDVRLRVGGKAFQIDFLIVTAHFILVTEVKNLSGTIRIDTDSVFKRIINGEESVMEDALVQVTRQMNAMQRWLFNNNFHKIPIDWRVINANPTTSLIIETPDPNIHEKVINANKFPNHLKSLVSQYDKNQEPKLTNMEIKRLEKLIKDQHEPSDEDILKTIGLSESELFKGVPCPGCKKSFMGRKYGCWHCSKCGCQSMDAHVQVIYDYFLLIKPSITNQKCCRILNLKSRDTALRILKSMKLVVKGSGKTTTYHPRKRRGGRRVY